MLKFEDNGKVYHYFDNDGMMRERLGWGEDGIGDSLWRTSLALIAYGDEKIAKSIIDGCFSSDRIYRHPKLSASTDTSRDQVIMADCAFRLRYPEGHDMMKKKCKYRISKKFTWGENWFWLHGKYKTWRLLLSYQVFGIWFMPSYALHLFSWMVYCSGQKMPFIKWMLKKRVSKNNYLLRSLLGENIDIHISAKYKPMGDFRWQRPGVWPEGDYLTDEEAEYNDISTDVLEYILKRNKN